MHEHYAINLKQSKILNELKTTGKKKKKIEEKKHIEEVAQSSIQPDLEYNFKYVDSKPEYLIFLKALGHI